MPIENRNLEPGTRLIGSYKKETYVCTVEPGEEEDSGAFVLEDGSRHKSVSAAASKVMGGKAVNGWRFWTVEGDEPATSAASIRLGKTGRRKQKQSRTVFKTPNQQGLEEGKSRWFCSACMESFFVDGRDEPDACPKGHRNDDPELNAPAKAAASTEA